MSSITADQLTEAYIKLRNKKKQIEERHKQELRPINEAMERLELIAMQFLQANQLQSISSNGATCFIVNRRSYKIEDRDEFRSWCESNGRTDFFEARPAKAAIDEYVEAGNPLPPGLNVSSDVTVQFRAK